MKIVTYVLIYILMAFLMWFACKWLLVLEFAMKPYTQLGKTIATYGQHGLFFFIAFIITTYIFALMEKRKRSGKNE